MKSKKITGIRIQVAISCASIFLLFPGNSFTQDIHFSQQELTPLVLNPALAGNNGYLNSVFSTRTQWRAIPAPFNTVYGGADFKFKSLSSWNFIAGLDVMNDRAGDPAFITNSFNVYVGSAVRANEVLSVNAALSIGYRQSVIQPHTGQWASQFNGYEYDGSLLSGESFETYKVAGYSSAAGIVLDYSTNMTKRIVQSKKQVISGIAVYHLNRPDLSFLGQPDQRYPMRFSFFSRAELPIKGRQTIISPAVYYQMQGKFSELVFGSSFRYVIKNPSQYTYYIPRFNIGWGIFYRLNDAIIVKSFVDWADFSCAIAYDLNISQLRSDSGFRGAFELALSYRIQQNR